MLLVFRLVSCCEGTQFALPITTTASAQRLDSLGGRLPNTISGMYRFCLCQSRCTHNRCFRSHEKRIVVFDKSSLYGECVCVCACMCGGLLGRLVFKSLSIVDQNQLNKTAVSFVGYLLAEHLGHVSATHYPRALPTPPDCESLQQFL